MWLRFFPLLTIGAADDITNRKARLTVWSPGLSVFTENHIRVGCVLVSVAVTVG